VNSPGVGTIPFSSKEVESHSLRSNAALQLTNMSVEVRPSMSEIMEKTGTDKLSTHHYEKYYETWFRSWREKPGLKFLEIGAEQGKSLALWAEYFDNPEVILGLAYGSSANGTDTKVNTEGFATKNQDRLKVLWGDQSQQETMDKLCSLGPWDIIIDDGSHVPEHMIFSFVKLFPCVKPGGMYIIEDLETNYWDEGREIYGYKLKGTGIGSSPRDNAIEKLKQLVDVLNRYEICRPELSVLPGDDNIKSMTFGTNLIMFERLTEKEKGELRSACLHWKKNLVNSRNIHKWMREAKSSNIPQLINE
jgi:hypothetical protein